MSEKVKPIQCTQCNALVDLPAHINAEIMRVLLICDSCARKLPSGVYSNKRFTYLYVSEFELAEFMIKPVDSTKILVRIKKCGHEEKVKPKCPHCGRDCVLAAEHIWYCPPCVAELGADE